jgi:hypothetical protein
MDTVSSMLDKMTDAEWFELPVIKFTDQVREVAEMYGCVFGVYRNGVVEKVYSFGNMPFRVA